MGDIMDQDIHPILGILSDKEYRNYSVWPVGRERYTSEVVVKAIDAECAIDAYIEHLGNIGANIRPPRLVAVDKDTGERRTFCVTYKVMVSCLSKVEYK